MAQGKIRQLRGGGCSFCTASEENVGKRRCRHIPDGGSLNVKKVNGLNFVDISSAINSDKKFSVSEAKKEQKNYFSSLKTALTKKERTTILETMREFY